MYFFIEIISSIKLYSKGKDKYVTHSAGLFRLGSFTEATDFILKHHEKEGFYYEMYNKMVLDVIKSSNKVISLKLHGGPIQVLKKEKAPENFFKLIFEEKGTRKCFTTKNEFLTIGNCTDGDDNLFAEHKRESDKEMHKKIKDSCSEKSNPSIEKSTSTSNKLMSKETDSPSDDQSTHNSIVNFNLSGKTNETANDNEKSNEYVKGYSDALREFTHKISRNENRADVFNDVSHKKTNRTSSRRTITTKRIQQTRSYNV